MSIFVVVFNLRGQTTRDHTWGRHGVLPVSCLSDGSGRVFVSMERDLRAHRISVHRCNERTLVNRQ